MKWRALYPHVNLKGNSWMIVSRSLYANGKQITSVAELKTTNIEVWDNTNATVLKELVNGMPHRLFKVTYKHGKNTGY